MKIPSSKDFDKQVDELKRSLSDHPLENSFPGVDLLGNVWMINTLSGQAEKIFHLCDMKEEQREPLVNMMIDIVLKTEQYCEIPAPGEGR